MWDNRRRIVVVRGFIAGIAILLFTLITPVAWGAVADNHFSTPAVLADLNKDPELFSHQKTLPKLAPDFSLKDLNGRIVHLRDFRGRIVILHFWASWCPPCMSELPEIAKAARSFRSPRVQWLLVDLEKNMGGKAVFLGDFSSLGNVHYLVDPDEAVRNLYGLKHIPETYVIDRNGMFLYKGQAGQDWSRADFIGWLDKIIYEPGR